MSATSNKKRWDKRREEYAAKMKDPDEWEDREYSWTSQDGRVTPISELDDKHIENIAKLITEGRGNVRALETDVWGALRSEAINRGLKCVPLFNIDLRTVVARSNTGSTSYTQLGVQLRTNTSSTTSWASSWYSAPWSSR